MRHMEHATISQSSAPLRPHTDATETGRTTKGHGDRHFQSLILPELVSLPLFYEWLRKPFRRKTTPAAH